MIWRLKNLKNKFLGSLSIEACRVSRQTLCFSLLNDYVRRGVSPKRRDCQNNNPFWILCPGGFHENDESLVNQKLANYAWFGDWNCFMKKNEKWEMRKWEIGGRWVHWKEGENGRQPRPNGLVVSAGKWAASMAAENCTSCRKSIRTLSISVYGRANIFCEAHFLLPIASLGRDRREQGSTFSGQVSAIEARDAAIFTKNNVKSLANSKML